MSAKICSSDDGPCKFGLPVTVRFFWPGKEHEPQEVCARHGAWAERIADTLGFKLRVESIVTGQEGDGGPTRFELLEVDD